jgi:hypothetical protein
LIPAKRARRKAEVAKVEYEIRVSGVLPDSLLAEIEGVHVVVEPVQTVLRGPVLDQAALHGIINRIQRLGLDLLEVRRLTEEPPNEPSATESPSPS